MPSNKYLPFEHYVLTSKLSVEEIKKRLADNIEKNRIFRFSGFSHNTSKPYEGQIEGDKFTISRVINYRNSFLPVIKGSVSSYLGKTQIDVKVRPTIFVLIFISIWLGLVGLVCMGIIIIGLFQFQDILRNGFSPMVFIPFGLFVFGSLLTYFGFKIESKKSKTFLMSLFEIQEQKV